jgi:hypothetical protein
MKAASVMVLIATVATIVIGDAATPLLDVTSADDTSVTFRFSNPTRQQIFVSPIYMTEMLYEKAEFAGQATGWIASRPTPISDARDYFPLAPNRSFTFTVRRQERPWRITCIFSLKPIQIEDKPPPDKSTILTIQSASQPPLELHRP